MRGVKTDLATIQAVLFDIRNGESAQAACRKPNRPVWSTIFRMLQKDPALNNAYRAARAHALLRGNQA